VIGWRSLVSKRRALLAVIAIGAAILVVLPWTIRNAVRLNAFVPSQFGSRHVAGPRARACFEGFDIRRRDFEEVDVANRHRADGFA
jgi:hypothetical protein